MSESGGEASKDAGMSGAKPRPEGRVRECGRRPTRARSPCMERAMRPHGSARRLAISQEADARPWSWQCIHKEDDE